MFYVNTIKLILLYLSKYLFVKVIKNILHLTNVVLYSVPFIFFICLTVTDKNFVVLTSEFR